MSPGPEDVDIDEIAAPQGAASERGELDRSQPAPGRLVRVRDELTARLLVTAVGVLIAIAITSTGGRFDLALIVVVLVGTFVIAGSLSWDRHAYSSPQPWTADLRPLQTVRSTQPFSLAVLAALYWVAMPIATLNEAKPHGAPFLALSLGAAIGTALNLRNVARVERELTVTLCRRSRMFADRREAIWARPANENEHNATPPN